MVKKLLLSLLLIPAFADASYIQNTNIHDSSGGNLNSTSNALNVNVQNSSIAVTGSLGKTWDLTSGADSVSAVQSGTWTTGRTWSLFNTTDSVNVGNFPSTQAVTGTFFQATQPVSLLSLPALATGSNTIGAVNINGTVPISGSITATNSANGNPGSATPSQATQIGGSDGTNLRALKVSSTGVVSVDGSTVTQPISAASLPLPTGAAVESGGHLASIDTKLTSPLAVTGTFFQTTQPVSGTVTANAGTNLNTSALALETGGNLASINAKTPALGQTTMSGSQPVAFASDQTPLQVSQPDILITGAAAQTVLGNNILLASAGTAANDVSGYRSGSVQVVSTGTAGTFIFENSNDGVNFQTMTVFNSTVVTGTPIIAAITATASQLIYTFPIRARYIRVRIVTAITGGSLQAFTRISQESWSPAIVTVANSTSASLQTTVTGALTTVTTVSAVTSGNLGIPGIIADVASAALTTTTTTATLTPTFGVGYVVDIPVTVVSGTTPTLLVQVQESPDTGTNWVTVYTFPTITATGSYVSPPLYFKGNRVRYVQTVTGTTPSFTRAINRLQMSAVAAAPVNNNATFASAAVSVATTLVAPANAIGFILQNLNTNTTNLRYAIGATASSTNGMQLEPGRDTGEIHAGQNISICPESGTITYSLQWVQQ